MWVKVIVADELDKEGDPLPGVALLPSRCVDQLFICNEIITSRREDGLNTYTCFIDIAKAYDRVWRPAVVQTSLCGPGSRHPASANHVQEGGAQSTYPRKIQ